MVVQQPSKLNTRVRFPLPAPDFLQRHRPAPCLSASLGEMLDVAGDCRPAVHGLLPDRPDGTRKGRIGDRADGYADQRGVLVALHVDGRAAGRAEIRTEDIALVRVPLEHPGGTGNGKTIGRVISRDAERGTTSALTGDAVAGDDQRRGARQLHGHQSALARGFHWHAAFIVIAPRRALRTSPARLARRQRSGRVRPRSAGHRGGRWSRWRWRRRGDPAVFRPSLDQACQEARHAASPKLGETNV